MLSNFMANISQYKELIAVIVSSLALAISTGVAGFNFWSWNRKNLEDAKKGFTESISAMITARQKLDELRVSAEDKFGSIELVSI